MHRFRLMAVMILGGALAFAGQGGAGQGGQQNSSPAVELQLLPIRDSIYMLSGAGGNIALSVGPDGVLMVDTGASHASDSVLAAVRQLQQQLATNGLPEWNYAAQT